MGKCIRTLFNHTLLVVILVNPNTAQYVHLVCSLFRDIMSTTASSKIIMTTRCTYWYKSIVNIWWLMSTIDRAPVVHPTIWKCWTQMNQNCFFFFPTNLNSFSHYVNLLTRIFNSIVVYDVWLNMFCLSYVMCLSNCCICSVSSVR